MRGSANVYAFANYMLFCITHTKSRPNSADKASISHYNVGNYRYSIHIDIHSILMCGIANFFNVLHPL